MNNKKNWALTFDLDETLVLTSAIEPLRRSRKWSEAYKSFSRTQLPPATLQFLKKVGQRAELGVVTKSPRTYATKLLAHHGLDVPVLVAFHDVTMIKPHPEALLLASKKLGIAPPQCIYVGDDENDAQAARAAGFRFVGVCWGKRNGLERACTTWEEVYEKIDRLIIS